MALFRPFTMEPFDAELLGHTQAKPITYKAKRPSLIGHNSHFNPVEWSHTDSKIEGGLFGLQIMLQRVELTGLIKNIGN